MKVLVYSSIEEKINKTRWVRDGTHIDYYENGHKIIVPGADCKKLYTLSFKYTFKHDGDTVSFAYAQPYTYENLGETLKLAERNSA